MKFLIVFVAFFGLAFGSDLFVGSWKEDQYKREGLSDYIYERGMYVMAIWVVEFSNGVYKIRKIFA